MTPQEKQSAIQKNIINDDTPTIDGNKITYNEELEHTPFRIIGNDEIGYTTVIANYAITPATPTVETARDHLYTNFWHVIVNLILIGPEIIQIIQQVLKDGKPTHQSPDN